MTKRSQIKKINIGGAVNARMTPPSLKQKIIAREVGIICHNWSFVCAMYRVDQPAK
jgi:hypothetical protein